MKRTMEEFDSRIDGRGNKTMSKKHPAVTLVGNRYQPSKSKLEEPIVFPKGTTLRKLARALLRTARMKTIPTPK